MNPRAAWAALLLAYLSGCALFGVFSGEQRFGFSHAIHAREGLECGDCHVDWDKADAPGMPVLTACKLCHENLDAEKPPERRIDSLFDGETYRAARRSTLDDEIVFSHLRHATKPIECASCHRGIAESDLVDTVPALRMDDCMDCHRTEQVANDCATCHERLRTDVAPRTHLFQWDRLHGRAVRAHGTATVDDCSLCHTETTCRTCHETVPPDNHDNYFRRRGHGLYARMDRQNCAACHRSDSCDVCHQQTRPMNHAGAFGGTTSTHCLSCHFPLQDTDCFTCHKGTPSHAQATPLPPSHSLGMNCRMCHGAGQPLPHVDKGDDCIICHR